MFGTTAVETKQSELGPLTAQDIDFVDFQKTFSRRKKILCLQISALLSTTCNLRKFPKPKQTTREKKSQKYKRIPSQQNNILMAKMYTDAFPYNTILENFEIIIEFA